MQDGDESLVWSNWKLLSEPKAISAPSKPGLYRARDASSKTILYVGETGAKSGLGGRISQLRTCLRDEMPYADPHTAAPALWAYLADGGGPIEISFAIFEGNKQTRMSHEAVLISQLRDSVGESPLASFGRMPNGWLKSTGNNKRLTNSGKRHRGKRDDSQIRNSSMTSSLDRDKSPIDSNWGSLNWATWNTQPPIEAFNGIYRIRQSSQSTLVYIGEGIVSDRLRAHVNKGLNPHHQQFEFFSPNLQFSWVSTPELTSTQRKELENDLIASHFLFTGLCPPAQFLG
jgi:hypothetical protein